MGVVVSSYVVDAISRWQKIGGIDMLSHRPLFFPFFLLFFRQLPLDTLWTLSGHSSHSSEFNAILIYGVYQSKTYTNPIPDIYQLPDTFCHPQLLNPAAPVHLDMLKGSPSGEQSPQRYVL